MFGAVYTTLVLTRLHVCVPIPSAGLERRERPMYGLDRTNWLLDLINQRPVVRCKYTELHHTKSTSRHKASNKDEWSIYISSKKIGMIQLINYGLIELIINRLAFLTNFISYTCKISLCVTHPRNMYDVSYGVLVSGFNKELISRLCRVFVQKYDTFDWLPERYVTYLYFWCCYRWK